MNRRTTSDRPGGWPGGPAPSHLATPDPHPRRPALAVWGLGKVHGAGPAAVRALDGVDAELADGSFTAVMGPSGSGKSTLLSCVAGLEPATEGGVVIEGHDITDWDEEARTRFRRERLGFVFQGFHLVPYLTARQNVELPLRLAGRRGDSRRARALLERMELGDRSDHLPATLSGGQQQRVAIARALVTDPAVILADEPTGALDSATARGVLDLLRGCVDELGQTVVMVTHDPVAAACADVVLFLVDGRLAGRMARPTADAVAGQLANLDQLAAAGLVTGGVA